MLEGISALNKIAIFDSGVGGLGVLKLLEQAKISEEILYYADNKNVPFGNKSKEEILKIGQDALDFLNSQNVDLIILACNTVSSILPYLKTSTKTLPISDFAIIGLTKIKNNKNTLVIATKATINSGIYQEACKKMNIIADFINPLEFVPIVESMEFSRANQYIPKYFYKNNYEYILYACTHYPFLKKEINNYFLNSITIDPALILLEEFCNVKKVEHTSITFKASKDTKILQDFYERIRHE